MGATVFAFVSGAFAALVPTFVSIYNPHQIAADPLFEPDAVRNALIAAVIVVPLAWLFGRTWSRGLVNRILIIGICLTVLAIVSLFIAASRPTYSAGPWLFVAALASTIAVPCLALLTHAILKQGENK